MRAAWHLASRTLKSHFNKFSRHDFTLPQLFACLAQRVKRLLDEQIHWAVGARMLGLSAKPLAMDSSMYESHHVSRHYEHRKARSERKRKSPAKSRRKQTVKSLPKLAVAVDCRSHLVLSLWTGTGLGSDSPHFEPLLSGARRRAPGPVFRSWP